MPAYRAGTDTVTLITAHQNMDFDALASMVAASKLYAGSTLYMPWGYEGAVKRFMTLFKHKYPLKNNPDLEKVERVVFVDRLPRTLPQVLLDAINTQKPEIIIYSHHAGQESLPGHKVKKTEFPYGSCAAGLVEELMEKGIEITPDEALLYLLGIHTDTGSFSYISTTPADIRIAAGLYEKNINMKLFSSFLNEEFDAPQVKLFNRLMKNMQQFEVKGHKIIITYARFKQHISHLSDVTEQMARVNSADAIISVAQMENKIFLTGRSASPNIDIRPILQEFKGGGHKSAAAAVVQVKKGVTIKNIKDRVYEGFINAVQERYTVADLMSSPVRAIPPTLTINEAYKVVIRFNNNGLPVVKEDRLMGFITKEDLEKGMQHNLGSIPVSGYMSTKVITVSEETPVPEAQRLMLKYNIGHLPVVKGDTLTGIVTRTDLLNYLYNESPVKKQKIVFRESGLNVAAEMEQKLEPETFKFIRDIGAYADEFGVDVYLVGGIVRDLFLKVKDLDIDITVEGDGMEFARFLADKLKGSYKAFDRFKTAKVFLEGGRRIDVTSARAEFYEYPAALPEIEFTAIRYDLYRRDFTINALAIQINRSSFGRFIDYFDGYEDLKNGVIKTLYNMSFIDDPTRILRAVRFEQRLGFKFEENTARFIRETLKYNIFESMPGERIRDEILILLDEEVPLKPIKRLDTLGVLEKIHPALELTERAEALFRKSSRFMEKHIIAEAAGDYDRPLVYMLLLTSDMKEPEALEVMQRLKAKNSWIKTAAAVRTHEKKIHQTLEKKTSSASAVHAALKHLSYEALIYLAIASESEASVKRIEEFITKLKGIKPRVTGADLKKMGMKPGPVFSEILEAVSEAKLNGGLSTKKEEMDFVKKNYL